MKSGFRVQCLAYFSKQTNLETAASEGANGRIEVELRMEKSSGACMVGWRKFLFGPSGEAASGDAAVGRWTPFHSSLACLCRSPNLVQPLANSTWTSSASSGDSSTLLSSPTTHTLLPPGTVIRLPISQVPSAQLIIILCYYDIHALADSPCCPGTEVSPI
jgi:hypothetical protein